MSDDDFFDSPREGRSSKKHGWSCNEMSGKPSTATGSQPRNWVASDGRPVLERIPASDTDTDNEPDSHRNARSKSLESSSVQRTITKIPTCKSEYKHSSDSDDETSGAVGKPRGKRTSRSTSRSESNNSSRSSSRSGSSGSDRKQNTKYKQAWGDESRTKAREKKVPNRPKTSHNRHHVRPQGSCSNSSEERINQSRSGSRDSKQSGASSSLTETESDSDMTDVSPLNSSHRGYTPRTSPKKTKSVEIKDSCSSIRAPQCLMHNDYSYAQSERKARPKSAQDRGYEHLLRADKDSVNLKVLMQAILEMERDKEEELKCRGNKKFKVPPQAHSIAGSITSQSSYSASRKNFSFTNSRVKDIDRENQRLMSKILKQGLKKKKSTEKHKSSTSQPMTASHRLTSSAVNRLKEQQRIDQDNRAMLKRLERAKATKTLQKDELNRELFNTTYVGVPLGVIHALKTQASCRPGSKSPYESSRRPSSAVSSRRAHSAASFRSDASSVMSDGTHLSGSTVKSSGRAGSTGRARPKSAHVTTRTRPGGDPPIFRAKRPEWEAGW